LPKICASKGLERQPAYRLVSLRHELQYFSQSTRELPVSLHRFHVNVKISARLQLCKHHVHALLLLTIRSVI